MASPSRSGVFEMATDHRVELFSESISFDRRLYAHDIRGSIAHAQMLASVGVLLAEEAEQIEAGLLQIQAQIEAGEMVFQIGLEDIHMHIEQALIDQLGDVGRKLHTGRSRNDQVSTATRLWIRDAIDRVDGLLAEVQRAFIDRCDHDVEVILPAYTHLQRARKTSRVHKRDSAKT